MLTVYHRGLKRNRDLEATVAMLWEYWKEYHLPWRLRAKVERMHEYQRTLRREVSFLRRLHELNRKKEEK